jgi:hypothetical protein
MLPDRYTVTPGSGTFPYFQTSPAVEATAAAIPEGTIPIGAKTDGNINSGEGVVVLNPEDHSIHLGIRTQNVVVGTSAIALPPDSFVNRRALVIHNLAGNNTVYIGASNVTIANGLPLVAGEKISIDIQGHENVKVYAISDIGSQNVRIMELS